MNDHSSALLLLIATLKSWRGLWLMSLPPLGVALMHHCSIIAAGLFTTVGVIWYHCWRLWLDQRYFSVMQTGMNNEALGLALAGLWQRPMLRCLTFNGRQRGAMRCLKRASLITVGLWGVTAVVLWRGFIM